MGTPEYTEAAIEVHDIVRRRPLRDRVIGQAPQPVIVKNNLDNVFSPSRDEKIWWGAANWFWHTTKREQWFLDSPDPTVTSRAEGRGVPANAPASAGPAPASSAWRGDERMRAPVGQYIIRRLLLHDPDGDRDLDHLVHHHPAAARRLPDLLHRDAGGGRRRRRPGRRSRRCASSTVSASRSTSSTSSGSPAWFSGDFGQSLRVEAARSRS